MEILSRKLRQLKSYSHFSYHPCCSRIGLTHLIFADDLMVFVRGDLPSVKAVHTTLSEFASNSGLVANADKTGIYFGGVHPAVRHLILEATNFVEETFSFKYLGIPLSSSKLTRELHHSLIHKIKNKLLHWTSLTLSYSGKLQLLNSVIFGMENFWCSCLLLPKGVVKQIEKLCKQFLWGYRDGQRKLVWKAWSSVCLPKDEGGFDIREIFRLNKALLLRWVWKLFTSHDSIWAIWVKHYLLVNENWDTVAVKTTSSWGWRCVVCIRDELITKLGGVEQATTVLHQWTTGNKLRVQQAYDLFRRHGIKSKWYKLVWDPINLPRHSVITILALQNCLSTIDRLSTRGFQLVNRCYLCCQDAESVGHLFFSCAFSTQVLQAILLWNNITRRPQSLRRELKWQLQFNRGKNWRQKWIRCSLMATFYSLWQERNGRIFGNVCKKVEQIVYEIKYMVCVRLYTFVRGSSEEYIVYDMVI